MRHGLHQDVPMRGDQPIVGSLMSVDVIRALGWTLETLLMATLTASGGHHRHGFE
jgi:hypothetical protein